MEEGEWGGVQSKAKAGEVVTTLQGGGGNGPRRASPSPPLPSSPSPAVLPAILQWERKSSPPPSDSPDGAKSPPAVVPAGGAPLHAPSLPPPLTRPTSPLPQAPPPPPPPPPPSPPKVISPHHLVDIPGEKKEGGGGGGGGEEAMWATRAGAIKAGFVHAYSHYESKCFGQDEYRPVSAHTALHTEEHLPVSSSLPVPHPPPCRLPSSSSSSLPSCRRASPLLSVVGSMLQLDRCRPHHHRSNTAQHDTHRLSHCHCVSHTFAVLLMPRPAGVDGLMGCCDAADVVRCAAYDGCDGFDWRVGSRGEVGGGAAPPGPEHDDLLLRNHHTSAGRPRVRLRPHWREERGATGEGQAVGDRLLPVFNTPTGLPYAQINLATGATAPLSWTGGSSLLAELGTCQMEFFALSQRAGDDKWAKKSQKAIDVIDASRPSIPGLYPIYISPTHGGFTNNKIAWGAMGDSFYEYLLVTTTTTPTLPRHSPSHPIHW